MPAKRQPGHRQRGAGTVTVSRGDQVRQGVVIKEWQRTPMQLLHEYCQGKRRRQPQYHSARAPPGRFRARCVLPDDKSSAKDLAFCPEQDFASVDEARHCAALLALARVEAERPLERKLPEPYASLWLTLTGAAAGSAGGAAPADKKPPGRPKKKGKDAKPTAADKTTTEAQAAQAEEADAGPGIDLWAAAGEDPAPPPAPEAAPRIPTAITADRQFASRAEYERAQLEKAQRRNDRQRSRENRERANPPKTVLMGAACRDMLEDVLKRLGVVDDAPIAAPNAEATMAPDHEALYAQIRTELGRLGFQGQHIDGALQRCRREPDHSDDEFLTIVLDWLCLNVPEGELPKGFNPEGTQLDVVLSSASSGGASAAPTTKSPLASALVQRLMKFGYDRLDAVSIVEEFVEEQGATLNAGQDAATDDIVLRLLQVADRHVQQYLGLNDVVAAVADAIPSDFDEVIAQRQDEIFALEAIYDDKFSVHTDADPELGQHLSVAVTDEVTVEIVLPEHTKYPFEFPVVAATSTNTQHQSLLLPACFDALRACQNSLGDPMIYDICVALESALSMTKASSRIQLLNHPKSSLRTSSRESKTNPSTSPIPAVAKTDERKPRGKPRTDKQRAGKFVNRALQERLNELLLNQRKVKEKNDAFQDMIRARDKLPAAAECGNVLEYMVHHQVLLIAGQTGCGKTTQIPQFILDDYINRGRGGECQIICTQPRRIAAIGVATRVAQERCEEIADVVGYQIRMDAKKTANTRLLFCTTGVLLRRLLTDRSLTGVSHVIVDEVHERNVDTDFLLSILRDLLPHRPDLRLILMSATMNSQLFVNYFSTGSKPRCPVLEIPGFTYPVDCNYLEDILEMSNYQIPKKMLLDKKKKQQSPGGDNTTQAKSERPLSELTACELAELIDDSKLDYDLCAHVVKYLVDVDNCGGQTSSGAILIFLPGTAEIKRLIEILTTQNKELATKLWVLPLHGSLSGADQSQVFRAPPHGKTKVIVSTNIAETSITINDITAVIDCGKVKEMVYDSQLRRSQLLDCWASRAACDQRKGRAGRVQAGTCYRLFSRKRFEKMEEQLAAEIHRVSLEQLCLQIKKLELGPIRDFLSKAIEPPKDEAIEAAINELIAISAFKRTNVTDEKRRSGGKEEVRLTPLGSHLAMLPLDARIGKFLIFGSILRCITPVATIAACISSKNPFVMSMGDSDVKHRQDTLKKELNAGSKSDHLLLARLLDRYSTLKGQREKRPFCKEYGLSYDTLETILELKSQYLQQLDVIGFYESRKHEDLNENSSFPRIVKAALCAGLYANVVQVVYPDQKYFQSAHGTFTEDHDAKKIRYFVRTNDIAIARSSPSQSPRERVFLHPSSCNFVQTQYDSPWLLYTELVQTSKIFVRESTMVNPYALLLFGGKIEVLHEKNLLCIDGWINFHAVARIGVLIKAIRRQLDSLLTQKIATPEIDIAESELVTAISHLLKTEGM